MKPQKKKFRSIPFSQKLKDRGFKPPSKGYQYQKFPGEEIYRQVNVKTGLSLKHKAGQTKFYGPFGDQKTSAKHFKEKYPQFKFYVEDNEENPIDWSKSLTRKNEKALKAGTTTTRQARPVVLKPGQEFAAPSHAPEIISKSVRWQVGKRTFEKPLHELKKIPSAKLKFIYKLSDGTTQTSKKYEKRLPLEIRHFKAAVEKGKGSDYRPGSAGGQAPVFSKSEQLGPGSKITTTRALVTKLIGGRKFKGNLKLAFNWQVFEGVGKAGELKGKSGAGFKFSAEKASKAFQGLYRRFVREHLVDVLMERDRSLKKYRYIDRIIKAAKLTRSARDKIVNQLKKQGIVPMSALALFFEMKILEAAKMRGVIISAAKAFKDHQGKKKSTKTSGLRSAADESWQSSFNLNIYKEGGK